MHKLTLRNGVLIFTIGLLTPYSVYAYTFTQFLQKGTTSSEVRELQIALKADASIYPEGIVSGYFGSLTEKAVQKFQAKYEVVNYGTPATTGYGLIGKRTRAKLNEVFGQANIQNPPPPVSIVPPTIIPFPPATIIPPSSPTDFSATAFGRPVETIMPSCSDQKNFEITSNNSSVTHFKPACFPSYYVQNEGFFLEKTNQPISMLPRTCGGFNILVLFFNTQSNRDLLRANSNIPQSIKNKIDSDTTKALTDLLNTYTYNDLFGFLPVKPEVSLKFTIKLSSKNSSLDLSNDVTDVASDYNKYDAVMLLDEIVALNGTKISGGNISKWPDRDPLFQVLSSRSFYAFKINPQNLIPGLVYNELFRRNVPVLFSEYTEGAQVLVHRDGFTYDETPIYNPRNNKQLSRSDRVLLSSILNGWYDVDHNGVQDCRQNIIKPTSDNVDGDMIPDDFDPDLNKDNSTFFWKSF